MLLLAVPDAYVRRADPRRFASARQPDLQATVYNTLNLFSRHGIAREVAVDPSRLVYDSTTEPHHHFYNIDTGE